MSLFDLERICRETLVRHVDFHEEIGSTNTRAMDLAGKIETFPALVLAERQTAGRGRGNNRWWTSDGGLTCSLLLNSSDFAIPASRWPMISLTTGLAVAEAIGNFVPGADVRLKWPNDVFLNSRKVCGILVETASNRAGLIVIGIGLNVNNSVSHAPTELQSIATSLVDVAGQRFDPTEILISVLQQFSHYLTWTRTEDARLAESWRARCYLDGRTIQVSSGQVSSGQVSSGQVSSGGPGLPVNTGVCQGIDDSGALLLQTESGVIRCVSGIVTKIL